MQIALACCILYQYFIIAYMRIYVGLQLFYDLLENIVVGPIYTITSPNTSGSTSKGNSG